MQPTNALPPLPSSSGTAPWNADAGEHELWWLAQRRRSLMEAALAVFVIASAIFTTAVLT